MNYSNLTVKICNPNTIKFVTKAASCPIFDAAFVIQKSETLPENTTGGKQMQPK